MRVGSKTVAQSYKSKLYHVCEYSQGQRLNGALEALDRSGARTPPAVERAEQDTATLVVRSEDIRSDGDFRPD